VDLVLLRVAAASYVTGAPHLGQSKVCGIYSQIYTIEEAVEREPWPGT